MLKFDIITIFPHIFDSYFNTSIIHRAQKFNFIRIKNHDLRKFTTDAHKTVDSKPYGGGPGMILKIEPIYKALKSIRKNKNTKIVLLTPKGRPFNQVTAKRYSKLSRIVLVCGRYEGIDERVNKFVDEEICVGPYVLTGGELPAMTIIDATTRLIPGVIKQESLKQESFSSLNIEYPQYTRPEVFTYKHKCGKLKKLKTPKVLLSGNHKKIQEWRIKKSKK